MSNVKKLPNRPVIPASNPACVPLPFLIDIPTAARQLSATVFAVRELLRSGQIKYVIIGHKRLISPAALQEFIQKTEAYGERVA